MNDSPNQTETATKESQLFGVRKKTNEPLEMSLNQCIRIDNKYTICWRFASIFISILIIGRLSGVHSFYILQIRIYLTHTERLNPPCKSRNWLAMNCGPGCNMIPPLLCTAHRCVLCICVCRESRAIRQCMNRLCTANARMPMNGNASIKIVTRR